MSELTAQYLRSKGY
ncbi:hypothetical protein MKD33_05855, partial [Chromobacterium piscinae]